MGKKIGVTILVLILLFNLVPRANATEAWENGKAYTAMLTDAATAAGATVAAAVAAVEAAAFDLARAQSALNAAKSTAAAAGAVAAVAQAEAALASATATLAAAKAAAATAAAVVAGATIGTLIGQGLRGIWDWCWDPVCDLTFTNSAGVYMSATDDEVNQLIPEMIFMTTGQKMTQSDFELAGEEGRASWQFMFETVHMFLGASRGAAAATAGHDQDILYRVVPDLQNELDSFPRTILAFSDVLENTKLVSPVQSLEKEREKFDIAINNILNNLDPNSPDYDKAVKQLEMASSSFHNAQEKLSTVNYPSLVGSGGAFQDLTLDDFEQFIEDCTLIGDACLPPEEILMADKLLKSAGVFSPSMPSLGPVLAEYDAKGDNSAEFGMFTPMKTLNLAEMLQKSVTQLSEQGPWLNIDLEQSPITHAARSALDSQGIMVSIETGTGTKGEALDISVKFSDLSGGLVEHVNYNVKAIQDGKIVLEEMNVHDHDGVMRHMTTPLSVGASYETPVDVEVTFIGYGIPGEGDFFGPVGKVAEKQVVPEFGTITMMILVVSIVSIIALTTKSKVVSKI